MKDLRNNYLENRTGFNLLALLFTIGLIFPFHARGQNVEFNWVKQIKGISAVTGISSDIELDANGNIYLSGKFSQTFDFDPGPGVYTLSTIGSVPFVAKYTSNGNLLWAKKFDDSSTNTSFGTCQEISVDNLGNVYCIGGFNNKFDFDPGISTYTLDASNGQGFVCKLNSSGAFVWAGQICRDSTGGPVSIDIDNSGNLVIVGHFEKPNNDFDPGNGTYTLNAIGTIDLFVLNLSPTGGLNWVKQIGGVNSSIQSSYANLDHNGNILITGSFYGSSVDFNPGSNTYTINPSTGSGFVEILDINGNFINAWAFGGGINVSAGGDCINSDISGNVYLTAYFTGQCDFDPSPATATLASTGPNDVAICKYSQSGSLIWAKPISGTSYERALSLFIDSNNDLLIGGGFTGTIDFDPNNGTFTCNTLPGPTSDGFVLKLNSQGQFIWVKQIAGTWNKSVISIKSDSNGNIFVTGNAQQGADFDPGPGPACTATISALYYDPYILKLSPCSAPLAPVVNPSVVTSCGSASFALNASSTNSLTWRTQLMSNTYIDSVAAINTGMLAPGNYTYYAAAWNCCAESFPPAQVNVSVFPIPTISLVASKDTFCIGEPVVLTAQGGVSYVMGTTFSSGNFTVWPSQNTTYTVNGGDINNCVNTASIQLFYDPCTAITEQWLEQAVAVWPNPTADIVQLAITRNGVYSVEVYDNLGRLLFTKKIDIKDATPVTFNFNHQGVYQLVITSEAGRVVKKVVVE